jgi:hypothetical protein
VSRRRMRHRRGRAHVLVALATLTVACATVTPSAGLCQSLHTQALGSRVNAVCWSDESSVLEATDRPDLLGPYAEGSLQLLERFTRDREQLSPRGQTEVMVLSGYHYQLLHAGFVQGRAQYDLDVTLPAPLAATSITGPVRDVLTFLIETHRHAGVVSLNLIPMSSGSIGSITLHFEQWNLRRLTITQYGSEP